MNQSPNNPTIEFISGSFVVSTRMEDLPTVSSETVNLNTKKRGRGKETTMKKNNQARRKNQQQQPDRRRRRRRKLRNL
jgi:hypothetical protein